MRKVKKSENIRMKLEVENWFELSFSRAYTKLTWKISLDHERDI